MSKNISYKYLTVSSSSNQYCLDQMKNLDQSRLHTVYTMHQTQGRGQIGRTWYCGEGKDLAMSLVYFPNNLKAKNQFKLNMQFSLVIRELVEVLTHRKATIKWPNDIYIDDKKLAGILIQNMVRGANINSSILGVGINVNTSTFPKDLPNPCSVKQFTEGEMDILAIVHKSSERFLAMIAENHSFDSLKEEYEAFMYGKGVIRKYKAGEHIFDGVISGIEQDGQLRMLIDGQERLFAFREISYLAV